MGRPHLDATGDSGFKTGALLVVLFGHGDADSDGAESQTCCAISTRDCRECGGSLSLFVVVLLASSYACPPLPTLSITLTLMSNDLFGLLAWSRSLSSSSSVSYALPWIPIDLRHAPIPELASRSFLTCPFPLPFATLFHRDPTCFAISSTDSTSSCLTSDPTCSASDPTCFAMSSSDLTNQTSDPTGFAMSSVDPTKQPALTSESDKNLDLLPAMLSAVPTYDNIGALVWLVICNQFRPPATRRRRSARRGL